MAEFKYQEPFPIENDTTVYRLLTKDYVKTIECEGRKILKIEREGLELLAREAYADVSFYLRAAHLQKLADILKDPEASDNDKFVAHTMLMNQVVSAEGELPTCQDTGPQSALFPGSAFYHDRRKKHRDQSAGTDRPLCHTGQ